MTDNNEIPDPTMNYIDNKFDLLTGRIQTLENHICDFNLVNELVFSALRKLNNDDIDRIIGPTKDELDEQKRRKSTLADLWSRSSKGSSRHTDLQKQFYDLHQQLTDVEKIFTKKFF